jgi:hypothetical protein
MAISEGISCEICLRADEPEEMLSVAIPYAAHNPARAAVICRRCAREIAGAFASASEAEVDAEEQHES